MSIPAFRLGISRFDHMTSFVIQTPKGLLPAISAATPKHVSINSPSDTTLLTSPIRLASSEAITRPVSISSQAREAPIRRGNIQLTPMSQPEIPRRTKAVPNLADVLQYRTSLAQAIAKPPPAAAPFIAAMMGCLTSRMW